MLADSVKALVLPVTPEQAHQAAQTRQQRREQQQSQSHCHPAAESPTQAHLARRSRPRGHDDQLGWQGSACRGGQAKAVSGRSNRASSGTVWVRR